MTAPRPISRDVARANRRALIGAVGIVAVMGGVTAYSPTLYNLFCQVTGFAGTTQEAAAAPGGDAANDAVVKVRFDASLNGSMPWEFRASQSSIDVRPGVESIAFYTAHNPTDEWIAGSANYNVAPFKVGGHFVKIDCFCFERQVLAPGQTVEMPVIFYVDPEILDDPETQDVREITLSYTFFETELEDGDRTASVALSSSVN